MVCNKLHHRIARFLAHWLDQVKVKVIRPVKSAPIIPKAALIGGRRVTVENKKAD